MKCLSFALLFFFILGCSKQSVQTQCTTKKERGFTENQKKYWFSGMAEITSYRLEQARYGEIRQGTASIIFVTEPFSIASNTKADNPKDSDLTVLKMITNKNFVTGIYPYSVMSTSFLPFYEPSTALKISTSTQEWCGMTYMEMRQKPTPKIRIDSYFENESSDFFDIGSVLFENDLASIMRLNPDEILAGRVKMVPDFSYLRLMHKETKAYSANIMKSEKDGLIRIQIKYPNLNRNITYFFTNVFPYNLESWTDTYPSNGKLLETKATKINRIQTPYWKQNSNADQTLRKKLGFE